MTTAAAPRTPGRPAAGRATTAPERTGDHTPGGSSGPPRPSGYRAAVVLAVLLTVPAGYLVAKGELSAHDALVRFGCAWAFATGGVALVLSTVGGGAEVEASAEVESPVAAEPPAEGVTPAAGTAYADGSDGPPPD